jgi:phosphoglycerol transferase MdoB-like AlkP superfamily enzyme
MFRTFFSSRYCVLFSFIAAFLVCSFLLRSGLLLATVGKADLTFGAVVRIYLLGLVYDFGVALFLTALYALYLLLLPGKWINSIFNKIFTYGWLFLILLISIFSFFAEVTFWQEFESRFNFIAVDYLIYTYEVIQNINQSYPLPILISGVLLLDFAILYLFIRKNIFHTVFNSRTPFSKRILLSGVLLVLTVLYPVFLSNSFAETNSNRYQNELSKAGIYSFFAAFKNNDLNYNAFYRLLDKKKAYSILRLDLQTQNSSFLQQGYTIKRLISNPGTVYRPNVIMITVESLSAEFLGSFGNTSHLTPVLDSLSAHNLSFSNLYATGTRTVRGMEALTIATPPTPGNSVVRRQHNKNLTTIGNIFAKAGYSRTFYYGGDGYFDNMNEYFGSNGFDITDRGRNISVGESYTTKRTIISDKQVHFENAWGICDEDLYDAVIRGADAQYSKGKHFYDFVMTTSNHRPFTYPAGKVQQPSGSGRDGAVRYTDFAIGEFLNNIRHKPWYKNTVVIIVADHCASSAGKDEINISKYHIPCIILNLPEESKQDISQICSQVDIYPTLFHKLHWNYESNLFGKDVLNPAYQPRAFLGTYQELAYLKQDSLVVLSPHQQVKTYLYNKSKDTQVPVKLPGSVVDQAIAYYQTAYDLFTTGGMHQ